MLVFGVYIFVIFVLYISFVIIFVCCVTLYSGQPQHQTSNEIDVEQLSPTSLCTHLTAYQATVRTLHEQNDHNAELLGCLEAAVTEKDTEISRLHNEEMEKELRLQAQHRDFQAQLSAEQTAREQVTNTLELMHQELEALKEAQNGPNPLDFSVTDNADLNRECDRAEQGKRNMAKELERT